MLPQNYQQKKVMDSMLRNYNVGKHFGLEKTKSALMDVMVKHNITTDISKLPSYKREAFLKDVNKSGVGFYAKKALQENYGPQKMEKPKPETPSVIIKKDTYDEIVNKKKILESSKNVENSQQKTNRGGFSFFGFGSNKNVREAEYKDVVVHAEHKNDQEKIDEVRARLDQIQS